MRYLAFVVESRRGSTFREGTIAVIAASSTVHRSAKSASGRNTCVVLSFLVPFFR